MSNALEQASLIMVPSGYEDGTLGSLKPLDGTGDFTFSRGSDISATRVNEDGYIEKGYENLLLQSNTFDTTWTTSNASATSGQSGYDGSNDAWLLEKTNSGGDISQLVSANNLTTFSVYAKAATSSWLRFNIVGKANAFINLSNGDIGDIQGTAGITATTSDVGDGWYRCSFIYNTATTFNVSIIVADSNGSTSSPTGSIYIQDAMLNQGMVSYPYVETTTAPVAGGILEDMPRLDYTDSSCPALLLEPQRTNLIVYSEYFGSYYTINSVLNKTDNAANSPEGVQNATLISENTYSSAIPVISTGARYSLSGYQTATLYVKPENNARYFGISFGENAQRLRTTFDFENNTFNTINYNGDVSNGSLSYEELQNGWYRFIVTANFVTLVTNAAYQFAFLATNTYLFFAFQASDNRQFYIYGLQVEEGTYPTSYIPTYGTSQTRLEETATNTINADNDFTFYFECDKTPDDAGRYVNFSGNLGYLSSYSGSRIRWRYESSNLSSPLNEGVFKWLIRKDSTNIKMYVNGELKYTKAVPSGLQSFDLKQGAVHKILLFPTALSDDECIELTTI